MDDKILGDLRKGRRGAIAKAITMVENDPAGAGNLIKGIFPQTGGSVIIGITGPAGAGKSTLINKTAVALARMGSKPAVLAVDPTSHITGGAILGDRVRMSDSADSGIYIRSIASRGSTGAVSVSLRNSIRILEYAGFDPIIIESVGAGQTEVEISNIADITAVVFNPHTGDNIQAIKAGITEIGDIYIVNKCDLAGADRLYDAVRDFIVDSTHSKEDTAKTDSSAKKDPTDGPKSTPHSGIKPVERVIKTSAKQNATITRLAKALSEMSAVAREGRSDEKRRAKIRSELRDMAMTHMRAKLDDAIIHDPAVARAIDRLASGRSDPYDAGRRIARMLLK